MGELRIKIASEYTTHPGSRYISEGLWSGEDFRKKIFDKALHEAINSKVKLIIDLDGTSGYSTSFLEEVFGGAARDFGSDIVFKTVKVISLEEPYLEDDIIEYIKYANEIMA
jgi:hypothetical protein